MAAPLAAIIGLLISSDTIQHAKATHQSVTVYDELTYVILGLSVLILVSSLLRKRLFQGITLALFGLAIFNLHFWGFGVPFLLAGAWYLVRAYRLQQALKRAEGDAPSPPRPQRLRALERRRGRARTSATRRPPEPRPPEALLARGPRPRAGSVTQSVVRSPPACAAGGAAGATTTATKTTSRTAGNMKTEPRRARLSTTDTGETSVGSRGHGEGADHGARRRGARCRAAPRCSGGRRAS